MSKYTVIVKLSAVDIAWINYVRALFDLDRPVTESEYRKFIDHEQREGN